MASFATKYAIFWVEMLFELVMCGISVYHMHRFWRVRHFPVIDKRHPILVIPLNICAIVAVCVEKPLYLYMSIEKEVSYPRHSGYAIGETIAFWVGYYGMISIVTARAWLLAYDINMSLANSEQKWMHYLNSAQMGSTQKTHEWYLKHRNTLGNDRFLLVYVVIPTILVLCTISTTLNEITRTVNSSRVIQIVTFVLYFVVFFYNWKYKLPAYYDYIYLRSEMKLIMFFGSFSILLYFVYAVVRFLDPNEHVVSVFTILAIFNPFFALSLTGICLVSTFIVLKWSGLRNFYKQFKKMYGTTQGTRETMLKLRYETWHKKMIQRQIEKRQNRILLRQDDDMAALTMNWKELFQSILPRNTHRNSLDSLDSHIHDPNLSYNTLNQNHRQILSLTDILQVMHRLEIFMDFLFHEFSHENLLGISPLYVYTYMYIYVHIHTYTYIYMYMHMYTYTLYVHIRILCYVIIAVIEFSQFQNYYLRKSSNANIINSTNANNTVVDIGDTMSQTVRLPEEMVKSEIVFDESKTIEEKIILLTKKYLLNGAPLMLNVSYPVRTFFEQLNNLAGMSERDKAVIFVQPIREILNLMGDSFFRFSMTEMYNQLLKEHLNKQ
ncbi:hypothetical protein RFI_18401 [Reticulomyxa filosa]|uniref:RGS domain-containing protein n=1 Tax=Reticulomyxa filosa TaxID=46433 RepID=X6MXT6_RETFI|nr:hypothetical protein RFI_18401 [Reticulomyxa filosa]|eukprot:ETO18845.1 hypothetical protein RFI_18401 [Reticulomyxa filosa]